MPARARAAPVALLTLAAVTALLAAPAARADWQQAYLDGKAALESADYGRARALLERALREGPPPAAELVLGGRQQPYVPQLLLAQAHFELGECDAMRARLAEPALRSALAALPRETRLAERLRFCNPLLAQPAPQATGETVDEPATAASGQQTPAVAASGPAPMDSAPAAADSTTVANPDSPPPWPARPAPAETSPAVAANAPGAAPAPAAVPPPVEPVLPPPAPAALRVLAAAYLAGELDRAAATVDVELPQEPLALAHALLLRGAARWHLHWLGGVRDAGLAASADADLERAHRLQPALEPMSTVFSPRFRAHYAKLSSASDAADQR
jgi:hypothetical protein